MTATALPELLSENARSIRELFARPSGEERPEDEVEELVAYIFRLFEAVEGQDRRLEARLKAGDEAGKLRPAVARALVMHEDWLAALEGVRTNLQGRSAFDRKLLD